MVFERLNVVSLLRTLPQARSRPSRSLGWNLRGGRTLARRHEEWPGSARRSGGTEQNIGAPPQATSASTDAGAGGTVGALPQKWDISEALQPA